jgi:hypothetical protein
MDHLSSDFGGLGLSSAADEWKPPPGAPTSSSSQGLYSQQQERAPGPVSRLTMLNKQPHQQQQQPEQVQRSNSQDWQQLQQQQQLQLQHQADSDLNANAVKEFVPGRGWSAQSSTSSGGSVSAGIGEL